MQVDRGELRGESGLGPGAFRLALGHGCLHNVIRRNVAAGAGAARLKHSSKRDQGGHLSPVVSPRTPGTNLTTGHKAPMGYRSRPPAAICVKDSTGWPPVPSGCTAVKRRNQPPKELPREVRPFWRRVRSVLKRVRSVLERVAAVGEPGLTDEVGCCGVLGTNLPLSPCDMWHLGAWEALLEDGHDRRGQGRRSY